MPKVAHSGVNVKITYFGNSTKLFTNPHWRSRERRSVMHASRTEAQTHTWMWLYGKRTNVSLMWKRSIRRKEQTVHEPEPKQRKPAVPSCMQSGHTCNQHKDLSMQNCCLHWGDVNRTNNPRWTKFLHTSAQEAANRRPVVPPFYAHTQPVSECETGKSFVLLGLLIQNKPTQHQQTLTYH